MTKTKCKKRSDAGVSRADHIRFHAYRSWAEVVAEFDARHGERITETNARMICTKALRKLRAAIVEGIVHA